MMRVRNLSTSLHRPPLSTPHARRTHTVCRQILAMLQTELAGCNVTVANLPTLYRLLGLSYIIADHFTGLGSASSLLTTFVR